MSNTTTTCCSDHTGATISTDQANYDGLGPPYGAGIRGGYRAQTTAAGSFAPNAFGLHDVHGNVAELVQDCYGVLGYGIALPGSAGVLTPFAEVGLTEDAGLRRLRLGTRLKLAPADGRSSLALELGTERNETGGATPEHRVSLDLSLRY